MRKTITAAAVALALVLTGCSTTVSRVDDRPAAATSEAPSLAPTPSQAPAPAPQDEGIAAFGEAFTYVDNVSISVSAPTGYTPGEYAAGVDQANQLVFTLVLTNNSTEVLDPAVYSRVSSGGVEASSIFDFGGPMGDVGASPNTAVLPGQTVQWLEAYSVADPSAITFQVVPSFAYQDVIFTNIAD